MENSFKTTLIISVALHAGVFLTTALAPRPEKYIVLPVEMFFYNPPAAPQAPPAPPAPAADVLQKERDRDAIVESKKTRPKPQPKRVEQPKTPPPPPAPPAQPQQQTRPAQSLPGTDAAGRNVTPGSQISLDTAKFPYTYYTNTIVKKIGRNWQWSTGFGQLKTVLYFKIRRDGAIDEVTVKKPSGDRMYDQQAVRAIMLSSPFPPLPQGYDGEDLGVYFEFGFKE